MSSSTDTYPVPKHGWVCFHCGEHFPGTFAGQQKARHHFGDCPIEQPACQIDARAFRSMQDMVHRYQAEDTELHREIYKLKAEHYSALQREEEKGYARGLVDGRKYPEDKPFQLRIIDWMMETFSMEVCRNKIERNHRFLEESLELVQAMGCTQADAHMLVDYVYGRPVGEPEQEVGGVMVTLAALCAAADFSMADLGNRELERCWLNIERIRAKQASKPRHSPLPGAPEGKQT